MSTYRLSTGTVDNLQELVGIKGYDSNETYSLNDVVLTVVSDSVLLYRSLSNNNTASLSDATKWEPVELGGSSRNIGEIVQSTVPLTDAGLHLLDGALISGSGSYSDFVTYIAGLISTNPEIFASGYESETSIGSTISGGDLSGYPKANAFDGSTSTFWNSSQRGSTDIVGHSYLGRSGLTNPVKKVRMMQGYTNQTVNYCSQLLFQYSNDGTTWIDITSISDGANLIWQEWVLPDYTPTGDTHSFRVLAYGGFSGSTSNTWSIAELELYYWSANSEAIWQSAVTTYGVCGKFVYDSVNNTVRLPKITGFIEETTDVTALGDLIAAGLPNITGEVSAANDGASKGVFYNGSGCITVGGGSVTSLSYSIAGGSTTRNLRAYIDASSSSSIYGNSNTVQPQAIKVLVYIVVANSTKTNIQVDIDEIATDLNGKADVDASNFNATGKSFLSKIGFPDVTHFDDLTIGATGSSYIAPGNGWFSINKGLGTSNTFVQLKAVDANDAEIYASQTFGNNFGGRVFLPVVKGTKVVLDYSATGQNTYFKFIYAEGES